MPPQPDRPVESAQFPTSPGVLCRIDWWGTKPTARDIAMLREYLVFLEQAYTDEPTGGPVARVRAGGEAPA